MFNKKMVLLALGLLLIVPMAQADKVSDALIVFGPDGQVIAQVSVLESQEDPNAIYWIPDPSLINPAMFGYATTLLEHDGSYSDIFGICNCGGQLVLAFNSDGDGVPAAFGGQGYYYLPEGRGFFDATIYLNPELVARGFRAQFYSDGDVPEPGTLILFGSGLVALARKLRK